MHEEPHVQQYAETRVATYSCSKPVKCWGAAKGFGIVELEPTDFSRLSPRLPSPHSAPQYRSTLYSGTCDLYILNSPGLVSPWSSCLSVCYFTMWAT